MHTKHFYHIRSSSPECRFFLTISHHVKQIFQIKTVLIFQLLLTASKDVKLAVAAMFYIKYLSWPRSCEERYRKRARKLKTLSFVNFDLVYIRPGDFSIMGIDWQWQPYSNPLSFILIQQVSVYQSLTGQSPHLNYKCKN